MVLPPLPDEGEDAGRDEFARLGRIPYSRTEDRPAQKASQSLNLAQFARRRVIAGRRKTCTFGASATHSRAETQATLAQNERGASRLPFSLLWRSAILLCWIFEEFDFLLAACK